MADQNKENADRSIVHAGTFGNLAVAHAQVDLDGFADADTVKFLKLPKGAKILDGYAILDGGGADVSTMRLGIKGVDSTDQDDSDYFFGDTVLDTAALVRKNTTAVPLVLDEWAYVQGLIDGANVGAGACVVHVVVFYEFGGNG